MTKETTKFKTIMKMNQKHYLFNKYYNLNCLFLYFCNLKYIN